MTEPLSVVVTGVGGGGLGEQLLKALALASRPYRTIACDVTASSKGLMGVDRAYLVPPASDPDYVRCVIAVCHAERAPVLLAGSEPEIRRLSSHRSELEAANIFCPLNPPDVLETCLDKIKTMLAVTALGFRVPRTRLLRTISDVESVDFMPVVLKPSVGGGGSANILLAQTRSELMAFAEHLLSVGGAFILQEYVGTPDAEYTVGVLLSMDGDLINSIAVRRQILSMLSNRIKLHNRTGNASLGPILAISNGVSQGEIGPFPRVTGPCEALALALGCRGAVNIQCRVVGDDVYVFEINPRFSGTTSLRALVGYNEPDVLIRRHVLGEAIATRFPYQSGLVMRGLAEVLIEARDVRDAREL